MIKQAILGTFFGRVAMKLRNSADLILAVFKGAEQVGTLINDQLASVLIVKLCSSKKTFIDVGAHIGSVIASVLDHDLSISIIAIEAMPDKAARLLVKFPDIELHQCAVSEADGEVSFFVHTKRSGYSSLGKPSEGDKNINEITVPMKRLDTLISKDDIDMIKIDVEGAELGVLRGAEALILKNRPVIMFESGSVRDDGLEFSKEDMWFWFNERKYDILIPNRVAHNGPGLVKDSFIETHCFPRRTTNYFAVPIERRKEIRDCAREIQNIK